MEKECISYIEGLVTLPCCMRGKGKKIIQGIFSPQKRPINEINGQFMQFTRLNNAHPRMSIACGVRPRGESDEGNIFVKIEQRQGLCNRHRYHRCDTRRENACVTYVFIKNSVRVFMVKVSKKCLSRNCHSTIQEQLIIS